MASVGSVNINVNYVVNNNSMRNINNSIRNLQNQAPRLQTSFTAAFGKIAAACAAAFSVKAITDFSKKAVQLASDLQEVQNVVDVVFGSMSAEINEFAKNAMKNFGMSETAAKKYAGTYAAMAKSFKFTNEEVLMLSKSLVQMVGDTASFRNVTHDIANTKMKAIFTGETEALKEWGIVMTQTALQEFAHSRGIKKTIKEMTEKEKVILRYNFVMSQLNNDMGDFQRTSDNWSNALRSTQGKIESIMSTIGSGLITVLTPALNALNQFLDLIQKAADKFASFVALLYGKKASASEQEKAQAQIAAIGATATSSSEDLESLADGYEKAGSAAKKASESLASFDNVIQLADSSSSSSGTETAGASGFGLDEYTFEDAKLEETGLIIDKISSKLGDFKNRFTNLFDFSEIKKDFDSVGDSLIEMIKNLIPSAKTLVGSVFGLFKTEGLTVLSVGKDILESTTGGISLWLEQEKDRISEHWSKIFLNFSQGYDGIALIVADLGYILNTFFSLESTEQALANALGAVEGHITGSYLVISDFFSGISNFIADTIDENYFSLEDFFINASQLLSTVTGTIKNIITDTFQSVHNTFEKYIRPAFEQFQEGFSRAFGAVVDTWNSSIWPMIQIVADSIDNLWTSHLKPFVDEVLGMVGAFIECVATIYNKVISPIVKLCAEKFLPPIMMTLSVVWGAVEGLIQNVIDIVTGLMKFLKGIFEVITGLLQGDFQKICDGMLNILDGLIIAIANVFSSIVNVIIGALNGIIRAANKISVPGTDIGVNISEIPRWTPKLADGGIVYRETNFGNFIAGEAGAEAIVPLENSEYTRILAREIVRGMVEAGMGGDTYNISTAYLDKRGLEKLTQEINGVNKQLGARKGVIAYG